MSNATELAAKIMRPLCDGLASQGVSLNDPARPIYPEAIAMKIAEYLARENT